MHSCKQNRAGASQPSAPQAAELGLLLVDAGNVIKNNDSILAVINQTRPIYADFAVPQQSLQDVRAAMAGHIARSKPFMDFCRSA